MASLTNGRGTVWMGSRYGLWYYNDYSRPAHPASFRRLRHPLLDHSKELLALSISKGWLLIAAYDKMLALDLHAFARGKTILRYLNPQESAFTSFTEQNTTITARDSTVWFSTSDMLYHWDFPAWLRLPTYRVQPTLLLRSGGRNDSLSRTEPLSFEAGFSSFDLHLRYLSPDGMPRWINTALIKKGEKDSRPPPSLNATLSLRNLAPGSYRYLVEIYEQDGSTQRYEWRLRIRPRFYQTGLFWFGISALVLATLWFVIDSRRRQAVASEALRTQRAEMEAARSEAERQLSDLRLISLSSQFRPHFILNALNTIGASLRDKPEVRTVLSRLGESISLIFAHAQKGSVMHSFAQEWKLVQAVIEIHQHMYLKKLEKVLPGDEQLDRIADVPVPLGLLQIPVENALLHGLGNLETGPWQLQIALTEDADYWQVTISDNGVGRPRANNLSSATGHGTGTRNLQAILDIVNRRQPRPFSMQYTNEIFESNQNPHGTLLVLYIPKPLSHAGAPHLSGG